VSQLYQYCYITARSLKDTSTTQDGVITGKIKLKESERSVQTIQKRLLEEFLQGVRLRSWRKNFIKPRRLFGLFENLKIQKNQKKQKSTTCVSLLGHLLH